MASTTSRDTPVNGDTLPGFPRAQPGLKKFLATYRDTGDLRLAARAAGISADGAYGLFAKPEVQAWMRQTMLTALQDDARVARRFLRSVLDGSAFPEGRGATDNALKLRVEAAKALLDRAGYVAPKAAEPLPDGLRDPSEMTSEELRAFLARAEAELADRAQLVDEPNQGEPSPQLLDMLG